MELELIPTVVKEVKIQELGDHLIFVLSVVSSSVVLLFVILVTMT